jgi:hypothetical protein
MPGPPDDVPPSELFLKLKEAPFPTAVVNFPRKTPDGQPVGTTRIRVLGGEAQEEARVRALQGLKAKYKFTNDDLSVQPGVALLNDAQAREVLALACVTEKPIAGTEGEHPRYAQVFRDAKAIGETLSADESAVLLQAYALVQNKFGPFEKTVQTEEELSAWIKRLVEGAAEFPLQHLSSVHWAELASLLAARAYTLSAILESLLSSLPPTLASRLETYSLGTGYFGRRAAATSADGTETSPVDALKIADVEITIDDARAMVARMKAAEDMILSALDEADAARD